MVLATNPAPKDSRMTWIRSLGDIMTYAEAVEDEPWVLEDGCTPDFDADDVMMALRTGVVRVYSSHPIMPGIFVTPSRMEAQSYAGGGPVHSKVVFLEDVAWIDASQGQYAPVRG